MLNPEGNELIQWYWHLEQNKGMCVLLQPWICNTVNPSSSYLVTYQWKLKKKMLKSNGLFEHTHATPYKNTDKWRKFGMTKFRFSIMQFITEDDKRDKHPSIVKHINGSWCTPHFACRRGWQEGLVSHLADNLALHSETILHTVHELRNQIL